MNETDKFLFWNTWYFNRPQKVFDRLAELEEAYDGFELLCLSEATSAYHGLCQQLEQAGFNVAFKPTTTFKDGRAEGLAIASRAELPAVKFVELSRSRGINGVKHRHLALAATGGRTIATAHTSYDMVVNSSAQRRERQRLIRELPTRNTLFAGDLNTTLGKAMVTHLESADLIKLGDPRSRGTWQPRIGSLAFGPRLELDHAFVTPDLQARTWLTVDPTSYPSNHHPLVVTLEKS